MASLHKAEAYNQILSLINAALVNLREAVKLAEEAEAPFAMLPIRTMVIPVLHEVAAQLDGYRNDFVVHEDLEGYPRIGEYPSGRLHFEVKRVKWEEV